MKLTPETLEVHKDTSCLYQQGIILIVAFHCVVVKAVCIIFHFHLHQHIPVKMVTHLSASVCHYQILCCVYECERTASRMISRTVILSSCLGMLNMQIKKEKLYSVTHWVAIKVIIS